MTLVIQSCAGEPGRVGEVFFILPFQDLLLGRGDQEIEKFARSGKHRPGEPFVPSPPSGEHGELFVTTKLSRRQLFMRGGVDTIQLENIGKGSMRVNGVEQTSATVRENDVIMVGTSLVLLCKRRRKTLVGPPAEHAFGEPDRDGISGEGPGAWDLRQQIAHAAAADCHILIRAESGAGKELTAAAIHRQSRRRGMYVSRSAATITPSVGSWELFGNRVNKPNHGNPASKGLIGEADGGTLFLDEIGELPLELQAALLRVLDEGEYQLVGESVAVRVDLRVIGATNRDDTVFREDFRRRFLRVVVILPLRERREDIPFLIRNWALRAHRAQPARVRRFFPEGSDQPRIQPRLVEFLLRHPLRGNTRELQELLELALDASPGDELVLSESMAASVRTPPGMAASEDTASGERLGDAITANERDATTEPGPPSGKPSREKLVAWLERTDWNLTAVGRALGVHRNTVRTWMKEWGIPLKGP
jgi:two-component system nitrogen regulation response regulator GlnG/two-component system response regulator HydG